MLHGPSVGQELLVELHLVANPPDRWQEEPGRLGDRGRRAESVIQALGMRPLVEQAEPEVLASVRLVEARRDQDRRPETAHQDRPGRPIRDQEPGRLPFEGERSMER